MSLAYMSADQVKTLFATLARVAPGKFGPDLPAKLAEQLEGSGIENVTEVADTLFSLFPVLISSSKPVNETIEQLVDAIREQAPPGKDFAEGQIEQLRINLQKLLRVPSIYLGAKATSVITDNHATFLASRVLTDVRPIFALESTDLSGAVVVHNLKISYSSDSESDREFFVSLDDVDVQQLIDSLQRAQKKADSLRKFFVAAELPLIDLERA